MMTTEGSKPHQEIEECEICGEAHETRDCEETACATCEGGHSQGRLFWLRAGAWRAVASGSRWPTARSEIQTSATASATRMGRTGPSPQS